MHMVPSRVCVSLQFQFWPDWCLIQQRPHRMTKLDCEAWSRWRRDKTLSQWTSYRYWERCIQFGWVLCDCACVCFWTCVSACVSSSRGKHFTAQWWFNSQDNTTERRADAGKSCAQRGDGKVRGEGEEKRESDGGVQIKVSKTVT